MDGAAVKRALAGGCSVRDRLSALPDDLLLRVLSFLPAQEVVRTTVLSRRWADLWRSVPGINLVLSDFLSDSEDEEDWTAGRERMVDFVNNLLMLHRAPCLDAFRLATTFCGDDRVVDRWVRRAIKDDPLVIQISLSTFSLYQLPYLSSTPSCRRLRSLHLFGVSLVHSFAERLHSWWPELKDLTLRCCRTEFSSIESDKLENLVVFYCAPDQPVDVFAIRAPRLASLSVHLDIPFSLDAGNSLVRASISLKPGKFSPQRGAMLLGSLVNVTSFHLEGFQTVAVLDEVFDQVPIFHNLRTLSLSTTSDVTEFNALGRFLHKTPNLESLTLESFKMVPVVEHIDFPILKNLRTLCLLFCNLNDNFHILLHCLRNSPNLEKLKILYCELSNDSTGGKRKAKSKKTYSQSTNLAHFRCVKLECAEILRSEEDAGVPELVSFLLDFAAPTITIKVTSR